MDYNKYLKFFKYIFILLLILLVAVSVFPGNLVNLILIGDASTSPSSDKFSHFISYFVLFMLILIDKDGFKVLKTQIESIKMRFLIKTLKN